ncbi:MAG: hypothetical protein ACOC7J_03160, partial [Armatimonadota bacterium]
MTDERSTLQTVAGLHGLILAWETEGGVIEANYDYAVVPDEAPSTAGVVTLRCTLVADEECEALLEVSALRGVRATLCGEVVADGSPRIEPFGTTHPISLRRG